MRDGKTGLLSAIEVADTDAVQVFIQHGANTERDSSSNETMVYTAISLHAAELERQARYKARYTATKGLPTPRYLRVETLSKDYKSVASLLVHHSKPEIGFQRGNAQGETCLQLAFRKELPDIIELLVAKYVKAPQTHREEQAAFFATVSGNFGFLKRILQHHHADPDGVGIAEFRPLHSAISANRIDLMRLLIHSGADVNRKDVEQFSPLECASLGAGVEPVQFLLRSNVVIEGGEKDPKGLLKQALRSQHAAGADPARLGRDLHSNSPREHPAAPGLVEIRQQQRVPETRESTNVA